MANKIVNGVLNNNINERNTNLKNNKGKYEVYDKQLNVVIGEGYDVYATEDNHRIKEQNGDILNYTHGGNTEFSKELHGEYGVDRDNLKCYLQGEIKPSYKVSHYEGFNDYISYMIDMYAKEESYAGHLMGLMGVRDAAENLAYSIVPSMEGKSAQDVINEILQYSNPKFAMEADKVGIVRNINVANAVKGIVTTNINNFSGKDTKLGLITNQMYSNTLLTAAQFNSMRKTKYITPELEKLYGNNLSNVYNLSTLFSIDTYNGRIVEPDSGHYAGIKMPNGNVFDYLPSVISDFVLPGANSKGDSYDWSTHITHGEDDLKYGNTNSFSEHATSSKVITERDSFELLMYSEGVGKNETDSYSAAEYAYPSPTSINPISYVKTVDEVTDLSRESILSKTNKFLKQRKINTMLSRFFDSTTNEKSLIQSSVSKFGVSHGRNLLTKGAYENATGDNINGYVNPYCRVWTAHHQYSKMKNLIRPFIEEENFLPISELQREWFMFRGENGGSRLSEYGVLNKNGMVNITPTKEGEVDVKQCMFSIENLAWKDVLKDKKGSYRLTNNEFKPDNENVLSPEQIGEHGGRIMWFPPYDLNFQETASAQWSKNDFIGRGEPVYTYTNSTRSGTLDFTILVDHPSVVDYWMLDKKHLTGNEDDEQTLMRFFAGCETINPVPDVLENMNNGVYNGKDPKLIAEGKDIIFYTFFPNNYSGIDFYGGKSIINPFECIFGDRGKQNVTDTEEIKKDPKISIIEGTNNRVVSFHESGYVTFKYKVENPPENSEIEIAPLTEEGKRYDFKWELADGIITFDIEENNTTKARYCKYEVTIKNTMAYEEIFILQQYKNIPDEEYKNIYDVNYVKSDTTLDDAVVTAEAKNRVFMGYEMGVNPLSTTDFYYEENDGIIEYFLDKIYTPTEAESIFGKEELSNFVLGKTITITDLLPQTLTSDDMKENTPTVSGDTSAVSGDTPAVSGNTSGNTEIVGFYYEYYNGETSNAESIQSEIDGGKNRIKEIEKEIEKLEEKKREVDEEMAALLKKRDEKDEETKEPIIPENTTAYQQLTMLYNEKKEESSSISNEINNKVQVIALIKNEGEIQQDSFEITDAVRKKIEGVFKPTEEQQCTNPLYICYNFLSVEAIQEEIKNGSFKESEHVFNEPFTPYAKWKKMNIEKVKVNGKKSKPYSLLSSDEKVVKTQYSELINIPENDISYYDTIEKYWSVRCVGIDDTKIIDIPYVGFENKTKFSKSGIPIGKLEKKSSSENAEDTNIPSVSGDTSSKENSKENNKKEKYFINNGKIFTYDSKKDADKAALTILEIPKMSVVEFKESDLYIAIRDDSPNGINHYMYKEIYEIEYDKLEEELITKLKEEVGKDAVKFEEKYYENHKFSKLADMGVGLNYGKFQLFYTGKYNETGDMYETIQDFLAMHDFRKKEHQIEHSLFPSEPTENKNPYEDIGNGNNESGEGEQKPEEELQEMTYIVPKDYGFDEIVSDINKKHGTSITTKQIKEWNKDKIHGKGNAQYFYAKEKIVFYIPKKKEETTKQGGETSPANTTKMKSVAPTDTTTTTTNPPTDGNESGESADVLEYTVSGITKHTFTENSINQAKVFGKIRWDMKNPKLSFPVDASYSNDTFNNTTSYYDMESFGLNSTLEMVKEKVSKNATFSFGEVYAALNSTEDTKEMLKKYVLACERGVLQKYMKKEGEELEQLIKEADERIEYLYTIFNSGEKPEHLAITEILTKGTASSHGSDAKNKELAKNRDESIRKFLKTFPCLSKIEAANEASKVIPSEKNNIVPVDKEDGSDGGDISSLSAKYGRCCRTTIVVGEKDLTADELAYIEANKEQYDEEVRRKRARRYDNEKLFFEMLKENDDVAYNRLIDKVKYFSPAYHSITPEGFNARLTFLHQCTRQGPTETSSDITNKTGSASNLAFGRAPFCILRLGDFLNTKIVIDSINITYPDSQWDLNPEGIGVQFMMAKVSMQIHILGGSDISGPIKRLQNAVSFNYYANTSIYDNRSDIAVSYEDKAKSFYNVEARTWYTGDYSTK